MKTSPLCVGRACAGLTLLELLITLSVTLVLASVAIPSFSSMIQSTRLKGCADNLLTTLRHTHGESVKRGRPLYISLASSNGGANWCYGTSDTGSCDCNASTSCTVDGVVRVTRSTDSPGVRMTPSVSYNRFSFQPKRMTVTSGSVMFTAESGKQVKVIASGIGRVRTCSPDGDAHVYGYPEC